MTKFSEMTPQELRTAKSDLINRLASTLGPTRIANLTDESVILEGGVFPARYDDVDMELFVWGRASRSAGGGMSVHLLADAEYILVEFYNDYMNDYTEDEKGNS